MNNKRLLLCLIFFPIYIHAQISWKNLGQPQGLIVPCSFYTDSKKLVSCGLTHGDTIINHSYLSPDFATSWESLLESKNEEYIKYTTFISTETEHLKRDKTGNIVKSGTALADVTLGYIKVLDKDFNILSTFYMADRTLIWDFDISPENEIWIATNKGLLRSNDENKNYQTVSFANINTTAITFTDKGEIWISSTDGIFRSVNQGKDWKQVSAFHADSDILYFDQINRQILVINNTSTQWGFGNNKEGDVEYARFSEEGVPIGSGVFKNNYVYDVLSDANKHLYLATQSGLWDSQNQGESFINTAIQVPIYHILKADNYLFASTANGIYRTSISDISWIKKGISGLNITSLAANNTFLFAKADNNLSGHFYSDDHGVSWKENKNIISGNGGNIAALNNLVCLHVQGGTWCSEDNGITGKYVTKLNGNIYLPSYQTWYIQEYDKIWISKDKGINWTERVLPVSGSFSKAIVPNETSIFISGLEGTFQSINQGLTWEKLPFHCSPTCSIMESNRNGVLVISNGFKQHYYSRNYGVSWEKFTMPQNTVAKEIAISSSGQVAIATPDNILLSVDFKTWWPSIDETSVIKSTYGDVISLYFDDKNFLYVGIRGSSLFRSQFPVSLVAAETETIPNQLILLQNYPNPFNPATTINFTLPQTHNIHLEVFDVLGRSVQVLANRPFEAGSHEVMFDAKDLPSGIYVYRLKVGDSIITKKMSLMK